MVSIEVFVSLFPSWQFYFSICNSLTISPLLIALNQENQVMALKEKGISAEYLSSTQSTQAKNKVKFPQEFSPSPTYIMMSALMRLIIPQNYY